MEPRGRVEMGPFYAGNDPFREEKEGMETENVATQARVKGVFPSRSAAHVCKRDA